MPRRSSRKRRSTSGEDEAEEAYTSNLVPRSTSKSKRVRASRVIEREDGENENETDVNRCNSNRNMGMLFASQSAYLNENDVMEDDEDDPVPDADVEFHPDKVIKAFTQATQVAADDAAADELVGSVMRFILFACSTGKPCTLDRIKEVALNNEVTGKKSLMNLMGKAKVGLKDLFGYDLICEAYVNEAPKAKLEPIFKKGDNSRKKKGNQKEKEVVVLTKDRWLLINRNESDDLKVKRAQLDPERHKKGLLMVMLALISLSDCVISEKDLLDRLDDLGIKKKADSNGKENPFGTAEDVMREFLGENYLKRRKRQGETDVNGAVVWDITFGAKTYLEVGLGNIVKFMEQTTGQKLDKRDKARLFGLRTKDGNVVTALS